MLRFTLAFSLSLSFAAAQELPDKARVLKSNYETAVQRVTAPLTKTFVQELQKLRAEYAVAGDTKAAQAVEELIKNTENPPLTSPGSMPLAQMTIDQFKAWLATVEIVEQEGYQNFFTFDGNQILSRKPEVRQPRAHNNTTITVGKLFVPFTSTNATIVIDDSLQRAQVTYSTGGKYPARIRLKAKE